MTEVVPPEQNYLGKSYADWASEWWKWVCGIGPASDQRGQPLNPLRVNNDANETITGDGPVRFLAGSFGDIKGHVRRKCKIPPGTAIFFPVVNVICSEAEGDEKLVEGPTPGSRLLSVARLEMDKVTSIQARVDGVNIPDLWNHRIESNPFDLHLEEENILKDDEHHSVESGKSLAVTAGYYVLLKPLSIGTHDIYIRAMGQPSDHPDRPFESEVSYTVLVTP